MTQGKSAIAKVYQSLNFHSVQIQSVCLGVETRKNMYSKVQTKISYDYSADLSLVKILPRTVMDRQAHTYGQVFSW